MEPLSIALSLLLGLISPVGLVSDRVAEQQIRKQLYKAESLQVRIDNVPTYQLLTGKIDQVRVAGRGLYLTPDVRIEGLEIETDPIALVGLSTKLEKPLQAAVRLTLTEADINRAFLDPKFAEAFKNLGIDRTGKPGRYRLLNPQIKLLGGDRIRIAAQLTERGYPDVLNLTMETNITVVAGRSIVLVNPIVKVNDKLAPQILVDSLSKGASQRFDLNPFESMGMTIRVLKLEQIGTSLQLVGFTQVRPTPERIP